MNSRLRPGTQILVSLLSIALWFGFWVQNVLAYQDASAAGAQVSRGSQYTEQSSEQLQQLVAPIALYPDSLVAQILGGLLPFPSKSLRPTDGYKHIPI
jgi:hypothetical protein